MEHYPKTCCLTWCNTFISGNQNAPLSPTMVALSSIFSGPSPRYIPIPNASMVSMWAPSDRIYTRLSMLPRILLPIPMSPCLSHTFKSLDFDRLRLRQYHNPTVIRKCAHIYIYIHIYIIPTNLISIIYIYIYP